MRHIALHTLLLLFLCINTSQAQETKLIRKQYNTFYEEYYALNSDTAIKHGRYLRKYKNYVIERGTFKYGQKSNRWLYFSLDGIFDFEYDYNTQKIVKIANRQTPEEYIETPVFFDGSPIIPYLYIVQHVEYPAEAKQHNINGRITLAIHVDKNGRPVSLSLAKKLHPLLDNEVMQAAKTFPSQWKWIPATYNGENIPGEYQIDIEFELIDNTQ